MNINTNQVVTTPGPWTVLRIPGNDIEIHCGYPDNPQHKIVAVVLDDSTSNPTEGVMDDARLIAAAPELLAACNLLYARLSALTSGNKPYDPRDDSALTTARAAVAKATVNPNPATA